MPLSSSRLITQHSHVLQTFLLVHWEHPSSLDHSFFFFFFSFFFFLKFPFFLFFFLFFFFFSFFLSFFLFFICFFFLLSSFCYLCSFFSSHNSFHGQKATKDGLRIHVIVEKIKSQFDCINFTPFSIHYLIYGFILFMFTFYFILFYFFII